MSEATSRNSNNELDGDNGNDQEQLNAATTAKPLQDSIGPSRGLTVFGHESTEPVTAAGDVDLAGLPQRSRQPAFRAPAPAPELLPSSAPTRNSTVSGNDGKGQTTQVKTEVDLPLRPASQASPEKQGSESPAQTAGDSEHIEDVAQQKQNTGPRVHFVGDPLTPRPLPPPSPRSPHRALHMNVDDSAEHIEDVDQHDSDLQLARVPSQLPPQESSTAMDASQGRTTSPRLRPSQTIWPRLPRIAGPLRTRNHFLNGRMPLPASQIKRMSEGEKASLHRAERKRKSDEEPSDSPPEKRGRPLQDGYESADEEIPRGRSLQRHWNDIRHARDSTPAPEGELASAPHDLAIEEADPDLRLPVIAPNPSKPFNFVKEDKAYLPISWRRDENLANRLQDATVTGSWLTETWGPLPKVIASNHIRRNAPLVHPDDKVKEATESIGAGEDEHEDDSHVYRAPKGWTCEVCGEDEDETGEDLVLCHICGKVGYCSTKCMRADRVRHSRHCRRPVPPHFDASKIAKNPNAQCDNCCDLQSKDDLPGLVLCSRCGKAQYCSVECQEEHYREHQNLPCKLPDTAKDKSDTANDPSRTGQKLPDDGDEDETPWYRAPDVPEEWYKCSNCASKRHRDGGRLSLCRKCGKAQYCSLCCERAHKEKHATSCKRLKTPKFDVSKRSKNLNAKCNNCMGGREKVIDNGMLVLCPICGKTQYCSSPCQASHYVEHQHFCFVSAADESRDEDDEEDDEDDKNEDGNQSATSEGFYDETSQMDPIFAYSVDKEDEQCVPTQYSYYGSVTELLVDSQVGDIRGFRPWQLRHIEYLIVFGEQSPPAFWAANTELRAFIRIPGIGYGQPRGRTFRPHINAANIVDEGRDLEFETRSVKIWHQNGRRFRAFLEKPRLGGDLSARWDDDLRRYWRTVRWAMEMYRCSLHTKEYFVIDRSVYNPYAPRATGLSMGDQAQAQFAEPTTNKSSPNDDHDSSRDNGVGHPAPKARKQQASRVTCRQSTSPARPRFGIRISKGKATTTVKAVSEAPSKPPQVEDKHLESLEELQARTERMEAEARFYDEQCFSSKQQLSHMQASKEDLSSDAVKQDLLQQVERLKAVKARMLIDLQSSGAGTAQSRQDHRISADGWDLDQMEQALAASRAEQGVGREAGQDRTVASPLLPDPDEDSPPRPAAKGAVVEGQTQESEEPSEEEALRLAMAMSLEGVDSDTAVGEVPSSEAGPAPNQDSGASEELLQDVHELSEEEALRLAVEMSLQDADMDTA